MTTGQDVGYAVRRFWWVIGLGFITGLIVGYVLTPYPEFTTAFRATVLIPSDTEDTGSSERPELMILDDLGPFIESWAFAEYVAGAMYGDVGTADVYGMLDGSRYSRIATVGVSGEDQVLVLEIAQAAAKVFPEAINDFLVGAESREAVVQIIDPPLEPTQDHFMHWIRIGAISLLGGATAAATAIVLSPDRRIRSDTKPGWSVEDPA